MTDDADIRIQRIGVDLEAPSESSVIEFHCERIKRIENLERCTALKKLAIVSNLVEKIEKLDSNTALETLDLYQNNIKIIENIGHLHALRVLDVSFNQIEVIENLESLINLRELYLTNNKIATVENLCMLKQLELLELGSNRIREYGDIGALTALKSLWLGRNKITSMQVPPLPMLNKLSLQNNRIDTWDERLATGCPMLSELYLSFNGLKEVPAWINTMKMLKILDLGNNQISKINITEDNIYIEELWLNDNALEEEIDIEPLRRFSRLKVLYLERNPIQSKLGPSYRNRVLHILPRRSPALHIGNSQLEITQLDALEVSGRVCVD